MRSAPVQRRHATPTKENTSDTPDLQTGEAAERAVRKPSRRGRRAVIDATRAWEAAEVIETMVGRGYHLSHTYGMGWLLRELEDGTNHLGEQVMRYVEIDSAPEGQLGALLLRHQQRQRGQLR